MSNSFDRQANEIYGGYNNAAQASRYGGDSYADRQTSSYQGRQPQGADSYQQPFADQVNVLEGDKVNLMKRLNLVLQELETATHEKSDLAAKFRQQERVTEDLKRKLDEVSSLKKVVNRNLQDDLKHERDLNLQLRDDLERLEREKDTLLVKLNEEEKLATEINREASALNQNLMQKTDDLKNYELEHEHNSRRLKDLNEQLDNLRNQEINSKQQKRLLDEQLSDLTTQRNDLIQRMNELSDKYENYVNTMNAERSHIIQNNKRHVKLLTAKLLAQVMTENIRQKRKIAFSEIRGTSKEMSNLELRLAKLRKIMTSYYDDQRRHYLRKWYSKALNVVHENYKKHHLIDYNVHLKVKRSFFYQWRSAFLLRQKLMNGKINGIKILQRMTGSQSDGKLRNYLCKWRDFVELKQTQTDLLYSITSRRRQRLLRKGFVHWMHFASQEEKAEKFENLSNIITETWYKQRIFLGLKYAIHMEKTNTAISKFNAWQKFCDEKRKNKYFDAKTNFVDRIEHKRTERLLKQCYDAIRFHNVNTKFEATCEELEGKIPQKEELEYKKECLIKNKATETKRNALRNCYLKHCDVKAKALMIWRDHCKFYNHNMKRMKMRIINQYRKKLSYYFMKWKSGADGDVHMEMMVMTEDFENDNQNIQNDLTSKKQVRAKQAVCSGRMQTDKLERVRNFINRKGLKRAYDIWVKQATKHNNLDHACVKSAKTILRRRKKNAFDKFVAQCKAKKRGEYILKKEAWWHQKRSNVSLKDCWMSWLKHNHEVRLARKFVDRAIKGKNKNAKAAAFLAWKAAMSKHTQMMIMENIEEQKSRIVQHNESIKNVQEKIIADQSAAQATHSKMKSLNHKFMANCITRSFHMQLAKGFFTWKDMTKHHNDTRRLIRKILLYMMKQKIGMAFRTWSERHLRSKENQLSNHLNDKENERRTVVAQGEAEMAELTMEETNLANSLSEQIAQRDMLQNKFDQAFQTRVSRMQNNTYIEKDRNIFCQWADFVKREKNAVNVIGAIARRYLRAEVFQRIRMVARERQLDCNAEKVCVTFYKILLKARQREAMSRWRTITFGHVANEMQMTFETMEGTIQQNKDEYESLVKVKQERADRCIKQQNLRKAHTAFVEMAKILKALRVKQEVLNSNLQYMRNKRAVQKWFQRTQLTIYIRKRNEKTIKQYQLKQLAKCLAGMKAVLAHENRGIRLMNKVVSRMRHLDLTQSFQKWRQTTVSCRERDSESREHSSRSIEHILTRLLKKRMASALHALRGKAFKKDHKERFVARVMRHAGTYRMKYYWQRWKNFNDLTAIAHKVNTEGDIVQRRNQLARNVKLMRNHLIEEGYDPAKIDAYLMEKGDVQRNNMQKSVISFFFTNSEFDVVPKAFNSWKEYCMKKKLIRQRMRYCLNNLRHPLHGYFNKWKYDLHDAKKKYDDVKKEDLIEKILADEQIIGSTESKLGRMDDAIENLALQREHLLGNFIRGQKLALSLCHSNYLKTLQRAFNNWKNHCSDNEELALQEQIERTTGMIGELGKHVDKLQGINRGMLAENEELRQAALDGIEIAKVVQELTKERESLSQDLSDRASTIKKLIEDNNNLKVRLNIAQTEAKQLEMLNNQSYMGPAEREQTY